MVDDIIFPDHEQRQLDDPFEGFLLQQIVVGDEEVLSGRQGQGQVNGALGDNREMALEERQGTIGTTQPEFKQVGMGRGWQVLHEMLAGELDGMLGGIDGGGGDHREGNDGAWRRRRWRGLK